ncbi:MAG: tRNA (adenosine(37)-N6)-dimethylallyltransferase MiaA [Bacteroidetes bacterium]|nr:tRNA (adenosine(37)-N6)-dimethylallyltransferase MiaA [Bacteroidota bacterium]
MSAKLLKILLGPTGVGKTALAIQWAKAWGCPIVSCDSRQIYKEMAIGTAAPSLSEQDGVQHFFVGSHSIHQPYTAGKYELEALALLDKLFKTYDRLLMVGGSGLYIDAVCKGMDDFPQPDLVLRADLTERLNAEGIEALRFDLKRLDSRSYYEIDIKNPQRVVRALEVCLQTGRPFSSFKSGLERKRPFEICKTGIYMDRDKLYARIDSRVDKMMEEGLLEEVKNLIPYRKLPALLTVGYRELFDYLDGKQRLETSIDLIKLNTRRYAKRQSSYWRRDFSIQWLEV